MSRDRKLGKWLILAVFGMLILAEAALATHVRPAGAGQKRDALVVAYQACTSGTYQHGGTVNLASCSPAQQVSPNLTVGSQDANGLAAQSVGFVRHTVCASGTTASGTCSTPAGMAAPDVRLDVNVTDVRCRAGGPSQSNCEGGPFSDYDGELQIRDTLRLTDHNNAAPSAPTTFDKAATVVDFTRLITIPCTPNPAGGSAISIGGSCTLLTRFSAVAPGLVTGGKRQNIQVRGLELLDGGPDGLASSTSGNTLFLEPGLFVP